MSFTITHSSGAMERDPSLSSLPALLEELKVADAEHGDVAVTHESGWSLSVNRHNKMIFENVEEGDPSHMFDLSKSLILELFTALSLGDLETVGKQAWKPGYK